MYGTLVASQRVRPTRSIFTKITGMGHRMSNLHVLLKLERESGHKAAFFTGELAVGFLVPFQIAREAGDEFTLVARICS